MNSTNNYSRICQYEHILVGRNIILYMLGQDVRTPKTPLIHRKDANF